MATTPELFPDLNLGNDGENGLYPNYSFNNNSSFMDDSSSVSGGSSYPSNLSLVTTPNFPKEYPEHSFTVPPQIGPSSDSIPTTNNNPMNIPGIIPTSQPSNNADTKKISGQHSKKIQKLNEEITDSLESNNALKNEIFDLKKYYSLTLQSECMLATTFEVELEELNRQIKNLNKPVEMQVDAKLPVDIPIEQVVERARHKIKIIKPKGCSGNMPSNERFFKYYHGGKTINLSSSNAIAKDNNPHSSLTTSILAPTSEINQLKSALNKLKTERESLKDELSSTRKDTNTCIKIIKGYNKYLADQIIELRQKMSDSNNTVDAGDTKAMSENVEMHETQQSVLGKRKPDDRKDDRKDAIVPLPDFSDADEFNYSNNFLPSFNSTQNKKPRVDTASNHSVSDLAKRSVLS